MKQTIIRFTGEKEQLHKALKIFCAESEKTSNGYLIELLEKDPNIIKHLSK